MIFKYLKISKFNLGISIFVTGGLFLASIFLSPALSDTNIRIYANYTNITNKALAYSDTTTHPDLTREIINFYELSTGKKFTDEQKFWVIQGSIDEDRAPRWLNHFYDPIFDRGLQTPTVGINGYLSKNWAEYSSYQTINPGNIGNLWSGKGPVISGSWWGDFSYEAAVKDYSKSKEKESYVALGHVLHLIEDITVPEHTRNDPHPGGNTPSYYENWTKDNSSGLTKDLGKRVFNQGYKSVVYADLDSYFNNLATYTNTHFFSPRTINSPEYQKPKIVYEDGTFAYGKDENSELFDLARIIVDESRNKNYLLKNDQILQEYWLRLSRQAVINGAGVVELFLNQAEAAKRAEVAKQEIERRGAAQKSSLVGQIYNFFSSSETPANESASVNNNQPTESKSKISKREAAAKPTIVQKQALIAPEQAPGAAQTSSVAAQSAATGAISALNKNSTASVPAAPAPQTQAPKSAAPTVSFGGGGGGTVSNNPPATSNALSNQSQNAPESLNISTFQAGDLVINEIMYNPEGIDDKHEWVELYNNSGHEIILTGGSGGWKFDDGATSLHGLNEPPTNGSRGSMTVAAGGYLVLADNAEVFLTDHSGFNGAVIDTVMDLKNSTSTIKAIKIITPDKIVIDDVLYSNSWGADGNGKTLERKSAAGGSNDAANWAESAAPGGTPGAANNWQLSLTPAADNSAATTTLALATSTLNIATSTIAVATSTDQTASTTMDFAAATSTLNIATSILTVATSTQENASTTIQIAGLGTDVSATTTIAENTTWTLAGSPYRLFFDGTKRPTVAAGATLTIEPGVKIIPQSGGATAMEIQGTLNAIAIPGAPIIFTSAADADDSASTTPQAGDWLNVVFSKGSQGNLDYVEFRYGGEGIILPLHEMVNIVGATVSINHSKFENSQGAAVHFLDSSGAVENSIFSDNNCGISTDSANGVANVAYGSCYGVHTTGQVLSSIAPQIIGNQFIRNKNIGIEIRSGTAPIINNNIFTDNVYPIKIESSYPTITGSRLSNSTTSPNFLGGIAISGYTHFSFDFTLKNNPGLPYILETNGPALSPYVDAGATLTIESGSVFKIGHTFTALNVNGVFVASTTPDNPIVFTSLKDDARGGDTNGDGSASSPQNSDWANIKFLTGSVGSFVNTIFSYGGFGFVAPPPAPPILLADFPAVSVASSTNQFYVPVAADPQAVGYLKPNHDGVFDKIIVHNFAWGNPTNHKLNLTLFDKTDHWQQVAAWSLSDKQNINGEFSIAFPNNTFFITNHEYTFFLGDQEGTPNPMTYYNAAGGSATGAGAFYETAVQPFSNPAISIDSGATVVVQ